MTTVIRSNDPRGGLAYPFLSGEWEIVSRPFTDQEAVLPDTPAPIVSEPVLRWVKDDKVLDLVVPGMDTAEFLTRTGLQLSMHKGGYVLSKRLSRVMRPFRYYGFYHQADITLTYSPDLNPRLWDGCGLVSRTFVEQIANQLPLNDRHRRELLNCGRLEVTTLHAGGQDKGHCLVVEDLACDLLFPVGSAKTELRLTNGQVFVGFHPVHSEEGMCLDVQSLINLYPFFRPEQLLAWAGMESELFLDGIRHNHLNAVMNRLYQAESAADLNSLADWHVGEFLASGGNPMWFAGMVKAIAAQHLKRLGSRTEKLRFPIPGSRYYIFPAEVGGREVPEGHIELDPACATAWVNDHDWLTHTVKVLGGCDGDDALWVFPFQDEDGEKKVLVWRSPNQLGEFVVLKPTPNSHTLEWETVLGKLTWTPMKSRLLPPRIDSVIYHYGSLAEASDSSERSASYSITAMQSTIQRALNNQGCLGSYCNTLLLCKAIYGRLPDTLPATLEAVIDGAVKSGLDLSPVKAWNTLARQRMVAHGRRNPRYAMPHALLDRLPEKLQPQANVAESHWLDTLVNGMEQHQTQYQAEVEALAAEACPPLETFQYGRDWMAVGCEFRRLYSTIFRQENEAEDIDESRFEAARIVSETFLQRWPAEKQVCVLLGTLAYLYAQGSQNGVAVKDGMVWQLGRKGESGRSPGIAQHTLEALRQIGVLGEPVWTTVGPVLHYREAPCRHCAGVPVTFQGVWFNLHKTTIRDLDAMPQRMSDVSPTDREKAKTRVAELAQSRFVNMVLRTAVADDNRIITRTPHGNLFGYVQKGQELLAARHETWRIAWATAVDGNVRAILQPVV